MKLKKICAIFLAACMVMGTMTACGENKEKDASAKGEQGGTVKILTAVTGGKDEEEMELFVQKIEEATGLDVEMEKPASDYSQVMMQKLSGGEKYDLIYVSASEYANLVEQEALKDITEYVKNSEILSNNIEQQEWEDITIDGKVYAGFNKKEVFRAVALNNTLLKQAGIDYKKIEPTMDGYYEVFKKMKETS